MTMSPKKEGGEWFTKLPSISNSLHVFMTVAKYSRQYIPRKERGEQMVVV
jgi:hypothetical protein